MKMVFFTRRDLANPLAGGSEVLVDRLAAGAADHGHEVCVVAAGPVLRRGYGVRDGGGRYSQYLRAPLTYLRHHRDADLVVDVANGLSFFVPLWRRRPAICLVNHLHTEQWNQWFSPPIAALGRSLERKGIPKVYRGHLFVAVSRSTAASLEAIGVPAAQIRVVHNGIDVNDISESRSPEPLFVCLGRLVPHKRVELVLQAWEKVRPVIGGRLIIAGDGPERASLEATAGEAVTFAGQVSEEEKRRLLARAWLLLHPAMVEGWGLVVMEAAVAGTPTVAFDVPGLRDSVLHRRTGLLAQTDAEFVAYWVSMASNGLLRARMGQAARARTATFSWSSSVKQFLQVAQEAILLDGLPTFPSAAVMEERCI